MMNRAMRVRVSGPLAPYAEGFRTVLAERGYAPSSAAGQLQLMAHLSRWLVERGLGGHDLTPAAVEGFLRARRAAGSRQWLSSRGMSPLLGYLREVGFAASGSPVVASTPMEILLADYRDYLVSERGLVASTVCHYGDVARQFMLDRSAWGRPDLGGLTAAEVSEFVLANCGARSGGSATMVVGTRALLRYRYLAGLTPNRLTGSAACWPASSLPGRSSRARRPG
jgi:hypothetical protein